MQDASELLAEFYTGDILDVTAGKNWQSWLPTGVPVVALIVIMLTFGLHLDNKIGEQQTTINVVTTRLQKIEDAVKVLGNQQSDPTQKLIHDLLAAAQSSSDPAIAAKAAQAAAFLTATLKEHHRPASPEFFQDSVDILDAVPGGPHPNPQISKELLKTRIALAEYRSALEPAPNIGPTIDFRPPKPGQAAMVLNMPNSGFANINFLLEGDTTSALRIGPKLRGALSENVYFRNGVIKGGAQTLDGIHWSDAVFIGTHIRYNGGEVALQNVRFVNCTFDVPPDDRGTELIDYATLVSPNLTIG